MSSSVPPSPHRRRLVGVSTKMYFSHARTTQFIASFIDGHLQHHTSTNPNLAASLASKIDIFIIPDFLSLTSAVEQSTRRQTTDGPKVLVGAQDCHWEDSGPFTGEVSPSVLAEVGCSIVEIGHAERRRFFGETDAITAKKAQAVARNGMIPLICVGEGEAGGSPGQVEEAQEEVVRQVESCLEGVDEMKEVWIAYEPVWAIGAKEPAGKEHVRAVVRAVRKSEVVRRREGKGGMTRILYGGSAGPGLFAQLKEEDGVDGLFLGRFAHEEGQFWKTICEVAEVDDSKGRAE
ncbi:Triosephosphate isomerase [Sordaria brevicollis]|uniref:Triosephosphate isomerase n=1 Tax=Sordaria brevicollis TaxID=83679 RepID=A0AAE0PHT3_SORBR|nr:Triosephosphate isomerase [Sordaria brevicollis]